MRENCRDEMEYKRYMDAMKQSVLTAFYTPPEITDAIADVLHGHGIRPDRVLEPRQAWAYSWMRCWATSRMPM